MSITENQTEKGDTGGRSYWIEVVALLVLCALLWTCVGMWAGSGLIDTIHEWGMFWFGAVVVVLPTVVLVALILAWGMPKIAAGRGADRPQSWGRAAILLWFLVAFVVVLFGLFQMAR
ncbi:MAG: hypothetical protein PVH65_16985 [Chloroflexota bacterium]|jgi:uncharacterized membrane protein